MSEMKHHYLFCITLAALLCAACGGHDYVKSESAEQVVNPQHKAEQCPELRNGVWTYTLQEKSTDPLVRKKYELAGSTRAGFSIHETGSNKSWVIDGQNHRLQNGESVSGYCSAGVLEIDVVDAARKASHIHLEIMPEAGTGLWIETSGATTTRATLTMVPRKTYPCGRCEMKK